MSQPPRSNVDSYGFEWPSDFNHEQYEEFMSKYLTVLSRRARKWERLLNSKEGFRKSNKIKRYIRKGIPNGQRGVIWSTMSGAKELKDQKADLYTTILKGPMKQEIIETIDLDIPRTFPDNIYFKGTSADSKRESLRNVLLAFAHHNPSIGYCQGLNFIAGIMLLVTESEDMTFWLLQGLKERILPDYYTKEMTGLLTDIGVLEELIKNKVPQVHEHMQQTGVSWSMYVSKWFICLFAEVLPIETVLRIWDCLFYEGSKVLLRVAVTLVMKKQDKILAAKNFVEITEVFKSLPMGATVMECHTFMHAIFRTPGSFPRSYILKLREYCRQNVEKEQAHTKELHVQQKKRQEEERKARERAQQLKREQEEEEEAKRVKERAAAIESESAEEGVDAESENVQEKSAAESEKVEVKVDVESENVQVKSAAVSKGAQGGDGAESKGAKPFEGSPKGVSPITLGEGSSKSPILRENGSLPNEGNNKCAPVREDVANAISSRVETHQIQAVIETTSKDNLRNEDKMSAGGSLQSPSGANARLSK